MSVLDFMRASGLMAMTAAFHNSLCELKQAAYSGSNIKLRLMHLKMRSFFESPGWRIFFYILIWIYFLL